VLIDFAEAVFQPLLERMCQLVVRHPNPRLAVWDSARFAEKSLILLLFCRDGKFHPRGAGEGNDGPIGF
jgi:hypothetical protein